jgi:hypothetical protein
LEARGIPHLAKKLDGFTGFGKTRFSERTERELGFSPYMIA